MGQFISALFGGGDAKKEAAQSRQMTEISIDRQAQEARDRAAEAAGDYTAAKPVRGRGLLLSKESRGTATTLGAA